MKTLFVIVVILLSSLPVPLLSKDGGTLPADSGQAFDKPPTVLNQVAPKYPESMLSAGWEGTAYVKVLIDMNGNVADAEIEKVTISASKGDEAEKQDESQSPEGKDFRESALAAVRQWKFTPAQFEGKPISAWVTIPFRLRLSTEGKELPDEKAIKKTVRDILGGAGESKNLVTEKADLIFGKQRVNLLASLNGKYPKINLVEGKGAECVESNISSLGGSNVLVVWKSKLPQGKGERFHSIQLRKTGDTWKVVHWHVSW